MHLSSVILVLQFYHFMLMYLIYILIFVFYLNNNHFPTIFLIHHQSFYPLNSLKLLLSLVITYQIKYTYLYSFILY